MIGNVHIPPLSPPGPTKNDVFYAWSSDVDNFDKRECYVLFIKQEKIYFSTPGPAMALLGPPEPTDDACLLVVVVRGAFKIVFRKKLGICPN